ncbi:MAG: hypothetical protein QXL01_04450 [Thermoplasmatales archaeon]
MITTTNDLVERLKLLDEVTLIEILDLRSEEIVDRFADVILDRFDEIASQLDDDDEEEENPWFWER